MLLSIPFCQSVCRIYVKCLSYVESKPITALMLVATLYVLYIEDIYFMTNPALWSDDVIHSVTLGCLVIFFIEWVVRCICQKGPHPYLFSFFFWLDMTAMLSLIPNLVLWLGGSTTFDVGFLTLARSGRAARAGTRAARIIRVLNFIQKMRAAMLKRRKNKVTWSDQDQGDDEENQQNIKAKEQMGLVEEGNDMGSRLDKRITRYFVVCVGSMLIVTILVMQLLDEDCVASYAGDIKVLGNVLYHVGWDQESPVWTNSLESFLEGKVRMLFTVCPFSLLLAIRVCVSGHACWHYSSWTK